MANVLKLGSSKFQFHSIVNVAHMNLQLIYSSKRSNIPIFPTLRCCRLCKLVTYKFLTSLRLRITCPTFATLKSFISGIFLSHLICRECTHWTVDRSAGCNNGPQCLSCRRLKCEWCPVQHFWWLRFTSIICPLHAARWQKMMSPNQHFPNKIKDCA